MNEEMEKQYLRSLGARILSEANDLKRTPEALAAELGWPAEQIKSIIAGEMDRSTAQAVLQAMTDVYPISMADLWVEYDDTDHGVRLVTAADSEASHRIFDRQDSSGGSSPYYEYRDTAMSRTAPFKPEWIKELRVVADADPSNPDVAYNNGHLMHQATFFIGPVNFYWESNDQRHCVELNTGDSNYVTPFVPHSFTSRDSNNLGLILAITYGAEVRGALSEFGRMDPVELETLAADPREPGRAFTKLLARHAAAEALSMDQLNGLLVSAGLDESRARKLISEGGPAKDEIDVIAEALNIRPMDLEVSPLSESEVVVVRRRIDTVKRGYPDSEAPAYELTELARNKHQPLLKGFDVYVTGEGNGDMQHGLHEYVYNYGNTPAELIWGESHKAILEPGDSAYVRPMITHRFQRVLDTESARLVMMRVPGALTGSVINELSTYDPHGRDRVAMENKRWF